MSEAMRDSERLRVALTGERSALAAQRSQRESDVAMLVRQVGSFAPFCALFCKPQVLFARAASAGDNKMKASRAVWTTEALSRDSLQRC